MSCDKPDEIISKCSLLNGMRERNLELDRLMRRRFDPDLPITEFAADLLETASRLLDVQRASIWLYSNDNKEIHCFSLFDAVSREFSDYGALPSLSEEAFPEYFKAMKASRVIEAEDARTDPMTREFLDCYLKPFDIRSMLDAQIPALKGIRGVICCETVGRSRSWSPDDASFIASLAGLIGQMFERMEHEAMLEQLNLALGEAEQANEARSSFIAKMSHELRTPLNGVIGMAQALALTELSDRQKNKVEIILDSGEVLLTIINDVLDMARIDSGRIKICPGDADLKGLVQRRLDTFRASLTEKDVAAEATFAPDMPARLIFDQVRVGQCLSNLLSNAVKFTDAGRVDIACEVKPADGETYDVFITVADTGIGIAPEHLARLFSSFNQTDASISRRYEGTGLGLCISRRLARLMGGDVAVDSALGEGSRFTLSFKAKAASRQRNDARSTRLLEASTSLSRFSFLVVDDNATNRCVVRTVLQSQGAHVVEAENGVKALELLSQSEFDLVVLDIHMPEIDGFEVLRRIRRPDSGTSQVPVMALTADAMQSDRTKLLAAGMDGYVAKPLVLEDFFSEILRLLDTRPMETALQA